MKLWPRKQGANKQNSTIQKMNPSEPTAVSTSPLIRLQNITKIYHTGSGDFTALKKINLDIYASEFLGIIGKSGAGKTTLLNMISGISEITSGNVLYHAPNSNTPLRMNDLAEDALAAWRGQNLGVVYQSFELLPQLDLVTNIMLPQDFVGLFQPQISKERALELLDIVELTPHAYKLPAHISGGQKQRVAIARALVNDPAVIIADEPTGSLDTVTAETIFQIFEKLVTQGKTIIMVTHDKNLATRFSRTVQIVDGELHHDHHLQATTNGTITTDTAQTAHQPSPSTPRRRQSHMKDKPAILLNNVVKTYVNAAGEFTALKGINLSLDYGQFISIVGKSGSGKSTLLNMLTGIDHPTSGEVIIGGQNIYNLSESQRARWRGRNMGIVFQFFQLLPTLSLLENTILPMDYGNIHPVTERPQRAMELLKMVGLEEHAHDLPTAVSNGQQQSAAIARSMATDPPIIVADEPTGNLDSRSARNIINVFQNLAERGKTILIVTHDPSLTTLTDQTIIISDGEIIDDTIAKALALLDHPLMLQATHHAQKRTYAPGETILRQGERVDHFYMVSQGKIDIIVNDSHNVAQLGPGQFFGDVELVHHIDAVATVNTAVSQPAELTLIPKQHLHNLLQQSPLAHNELKRVAQQRYQENQTHQLPITL